MQRDFEEVLTWISALAANQEPTTFLDAIEVVRAIKPYPDPPLRLLDALLALHDAPLTTDGAREVLADYLRVRAAELAAERERATRPITLDDDGSRVRVGRGAVLHLHLEEARPVGARWDVASMEGDAIYERHANDPQRPRTALITLTLKRPGRVKLRLEERLAVTPRHTAHSQRRIDKPRVFELEVIVEESRQRTKDRD